MRRDVALDQPTIGSPLRWNAPIRAPTANAPYYNADRSGDGRRATARDQMKATKTIEMRQTDIRHAVRLLGLLSENEGDVTMIMRLIAEPLRRQVSAVMLPEWVVFHDG
jgi:hypothetical protein